MRHDRALLVACLLLAPLLLAGCTTEDTTRASPEVIRAVANTEAHAWSPGTWWSYAATFHQNRTFHVALVVHEAREDGFRLGSNISSGFFGLPFTGNVTDALNPEISGKVWPMYEFPLRDGKSWTYSLFGYDAKSTAYAALVDVPGIGEVPGFRLEASSYGQVFARYDYAPQVGWFTRLELIEPTNREQVLDVRLQEHGQRYGRGYFVEEVAQRIHVSYPNDLPGESALRSAAGYHRVRVSLSAEATAGVADARLEDAAGRVLIDARAVGKGLASERATLDENARGLTLRHAGSGVAEVHLELIGVRAAGATGVRYQEADATIDLSSLLAAAAPSGGAEEAEPSSDGVNAPGGQTPFPPRA